MSDPKPHPENQGTDANVKPGLPPAPAPIPHTEPPVAYQPVSGWAIASFAVGSLFALLVAITTVVGLIQGAPVFFPIWVMGLPILGIVLSVLAQRHVKNSEGTRVGAKLAQIGLWLSLVSGLCYFSYYYVTGLALQNQANAFLLEKSDDAGFFPRLREGASVVVAADLQEDGRIKSGLKPDPIELNRAFLLTQAPNSRSGRPDDERSMLRNFDASGKEGAPGQLTQFRWSLLPHIFFKQLGKDAEITPLAVQDWRYEQRSYKVARMYRIKTKEIEVDLLATAYSQEPEAAGMGRKWFINMRETQVLKKTLTPLGEGVSRLRQQARDWLEKKIAALNEGEPFAAIKDVDQSPWQVLAKDDERARLRAAVHHVFTAAGKPRVYQLQVLTRAEDPGMWEQTADGQIRIYVAFRCTLPKSPGEPPAYQADGMAVLETNRAVNPEQFGVDAAAPEWTIVGLAFMHIGPVPERKGPG